MDSKSQSNRKETAHCTKLAISTRLQQWMLLKSITYTRRGSKADPLLSKIKIQSPLSTHNNKQTAAQTPRATPAFKSLEEAPFNDRQSSDRSKALLFAPESKPSEMKKYLQQIPICHQKHPLRHHRA